MFMLDLFGKKSKAKAEMLRKENDELTRRLIEYEKTVEKLSASNDAFMKECNENFNKIQALESNVAHVNSELYQATSRLERRNADDAELLSKFTSEVASDYPSITNKKLRSFVDDMIVNIDLSKVSKKQPIRPEHYYTLKAISNLQSYLDLNGLTVRKK